MDDRARECLQDVLEQAEEAREFTSGMAVEAYLKDRKTQAAVERKFEIIGEALNRLHDADEDLLNQIRDYRSIISFRNILAHGYDSVDDLVVWGIIENDLDSLIEDAKRLLGIS
jgi:uncharacterized protein with HEPN domain